MGLFGHVWVFLGLFAHFSSTFRRLFVTFPKKMDALLSRATDEDIALILHELQTRLRSRFPASELRHVSTEVEDAPTSRRVSIWLAYRDPGDAKPQGLTAEERAVCVADVIFTESADCAICLQAHETHAVQLRCGHSFCRPCIAEWLERARTCPVCRKDVLCA